ncbi:MAG TPA: SRPBCC family protein [Gaiellaceae bacterium]|nr:SRPBCC family protein [Gaiellaceae bacterium]
MVKPGDTLEAPGLGMRLVFRRTAAETDGALLEYDVIGRPRGFPAQSHVHPSQAERHEVVSGALKVTMDGGSRVLGPGESILIPAGTAHRHYADGEAEGHVRVELRPALKTAELLERLAELDAAGQITARGFLRPLAAARLVTDFPDEGHAARPPARVQRAIARAVVAVADQSRGEYVFVDEWEVAAPAEAVFDALADARTYPEWWKPVYETVEADGPPAVGHVSRQHFKGRLPYHLDTTSTVVRLEPPRIVAGDVVGDLRGSGVWTVTPAGDGRTHVRFDWTVYADKPLLKVLTPVLRPLFRWNHNWAIERAKEGLEPYARKASS